MEINMSFRTFGVCTVAILGIYGLPLAFPHHLKSFYRKTDCEVPPELDAHVRKIAYLMGLLPAQVSKLNVFISKEMYSMSFGNFSSPRGAYIGLPRQVLWVAPEDVKKSTISRNGRPVDWSSDFGRRLANCLTPSGSQTNFRIAHELAHLKCNHLLYNLCLAPFHVLSLFIFLEFGSPYLQRRFRLTSRVLNGSALLVWAFAFVFDMRRIRHNFEFEADRIAAGVGRGFAEGGIELFYRQRQVALLLGEDDSDSAYTHPSFLDRQKRLQEVMIDSYQVTFD